jgi:hypothetical protein
LLLRFHEALAPEDHCATMQTQPGADFVDRDPVGGPQNDPGPIGQPPFGLAVALELPQGLLFLAVQANMVLVWLHHRPPCQGFLTMLPHSLLM